MEIEYVAVTIQNQIIVQRLHESGYKLYTIFDLGINGLKRTTMFSQCKILEEGQKAGPRRD